MSYVSRNKENALREQIILVGKLMYERGLVVGLDGNISARLPDGNILVTPSGVCKGLMTADQLIVVDMDGRKVGPETSSTRRLKPTSETLMHLEAYRQRPDVGGVVHAHPCTTIALSIAGISLADCVVPEAIVNLGLVPTADYATPASEENVGAIRDLIGRHDGIILRRHGSLTVGEDPWQAFVRLEFLEQVARITFMLRQLGMGQALPPEEVEKLLEQRRRAGLERPGERAEFAEICGICPVGDESPGVDEDERDLVRLITEAVLKELHKS